MKKSIKTLDLRNMPPFERHSKIFDMWNGLKEEETLRIINDHEPKPLYYQFEAEYKGRFEWNYEKQGPEDWIFTIKKTMDKIDRKQEMRKLCDVHLEVMKDNLGKPEMNLEPGHPLHTLTEEHKMILDFIEKLKETIKKIKAAKSFDSVSGELIILKHIAEHLVEADKHHQREEEVLFPALEKFGVTEPPEIMREEHEELKPKKKELYKTAKECKENSYPEFIRKAKELAEYLIKQLPDHIYKEDNILYPLALQVIPKKEWLKIKKKCDKIGYYCFTPEC